MNQEKKSILKVEGIHKSFSDKMVLNGVSLTLYAGETIGILGKSGGGKSTLFHIIAGLLEPDCGEIQLDGKLITGQPGKVHYMLQKDLLLPFYTIIDNVSLPLRLNGISKKEAYQIVNPLFETFDLTGTQNHYPTQLSGGMRQRAALLRTYVNSNGVFLFDEPFSALDAITKKSLQEWYHQISQEMNFSALFITHDIDEALYLCNRIFILENGIFVAEIDLSDKPPDFLLSPKSLEYKKEIIQILQS